VYLSSLWVYLVSISLVLSTSFFQSANGSDEPRVPVWFALSDTGRGKLSLEPFAQVVQGKLTSLPDACKEDDANYRKFSEKYLKPGNSYDVRAGGAAAGKATLAPARDVSGNYEVDYAGQARIRGRVMTLATTVPEISGRESKRQAPSASERAAATKLAMALYQQAGIPEAALPKMVVENLTKTVLKASTEPSLIGSFTIEERLSADNTRYDSLFLVASFSGSELTADLSEIHPSLGDTDSQTLALVDQADIFDSGQDNLVVQLGFYENYRYRVYGRTKDGKHWERIFETETMGCL